MSKIIFGLVLVLFCCSMVSSQSATVNLTLNDIRSFRTQSIASLSYQFNLLREEIFGHFSRSYRSMNSARQTIFTGLSRFPLYYLTTETRESFTGNMTMLLNDCLDPTVDYLEKDAMTSFANFAEDSLVEKAFEPAVTQLRELSTEVMKVTDGLCLLRATIGRRLAPEYTPAINAMNNCTRVISSTYRAPINEFIRVFFQAQPILVRIASDINRCAINVNRETCVKTLMKTVCGENDCEACKAVTAVKTQAEAMTTESKANYETCLTDAQAKFPQTTPLMADVMKCENATVPATSSDIEAEEEDEVDNELRSAFLRNEIFDELPEF